LTLELDQQVLVLRHQLFVLVIDLLGHVRHDLQVFIELFFCFVEIGFTFLLLVVFKLKLLTDAIEFLVQVLPQGFVLLLQYCLRIPLEGLNPFIDVIERFAYLLDFVCLGLRELFVLVAPIPISLIVIESCSGVIFVQL